MAQAKKKRNSKHRGNAAGVVETRGRTGRPLSEREQSKNKAASGAKKRIAVISLATKQKATPTRGRPVGASRSHGPGVAAILSLLVPRG